MTDQAVVQWTAEGAAKALSRSVNGSRSKADIAALLGVDPDSTDPKEAAKARAMLDRFVAVALHAATSDPKILRASKESLIQSIRDSALLGLEPVGVTGDGAIVVYDETVRVEKVSARGGTYIEQVKVPTAHFQPMYRGLLKLARRSDQLAHVDAHVVYDGDEITLDLGSSPSVKHYPALDGTKRGDFVGAYAVAELTNGRRYVEWMTVADIEVVRRSSRGGTKPDSPWVVYWAEMARKTVLRRLMKRLPLETMAEHGLRLEAEAESKGSPAPVAAIEAGDQAEAPTSSARKRLRSRFVAEEPENGTEAPSAPPETTDTAPEADAPVSGRSSGAEPADPTVDVPRDYEAAPRGGTVPAETPAATAPGEVVEGVVREVTPEEVAGNMTADQIAFVRGETDDPGNPPCRAIAPVELGFAEGTVCALPAGHAFPDGKPNAHQDKEGSRWPNR